MAATITATPNPASTTGVVTISWTGANGGWIEINGPTAKTFISAGTDSGSTNWWPPSVGTWTVALTDGHSKKKFAPSILAQVAVKVV